jgi:hypothetical protein
MGIRVSPVICQRTVLCRWLGANNRGPMTANGIYQMIARRGRQAGVDAWTLGSGVPFRC